MAPIRQILVAASAAAAAGCYNQRLELPPLHEAVANGQRARVQVLLDEGADPNAIDSRGDPPLYWALLTRNFAVADLLVKRGAKADAVGGDGKSIRVNFQGRETPEAARWLGER